MSKHTHLSAGVDVGSAAVKVAIVRSDAGATGEVLATSVHRIRRRAVRDVVEQAFDECCREAAVDPKSFCYVASTGDGDAVEFRTGHFYSMTTHARGALHLVPAARGVVDVGALHARAIRINDRGQVLGHKMTGQCASGSGQFVENIARYLGVPLDDVGQLSCKAKAPEEVSSICAVLAETDVINMVSRGISTGDILKGIHMSIAGRLARLIRAIKVEGTVAVTGGLAQDAGLVMTLREQLTAPPIKRHRVRGLAKVEVEVHPEAILAGAIGAALLGAYRYDQLQRRGRAPAAIIAASA